MEYKNGIVIIVSFENKYVKDFMLEKYIESIIDLITNNLTYYNIGVSEIHKSITSIDKAINQAISANNFEEQHNSIVYFRNIGLLKLLLPIKNNPELSEFFDDTINPIIDFDKKYNMDLLNTVEVFLY